VSTIYNQQQWLHVLHAVEVRDIPYFVMFLLVGTFELDVTDYLPSKYSEYQCVRVLWSVTAAKEHHAIARLCSDMMLHTRPQNGHVSTLEYTKLQLFNW
jgi:hypothetical protein